jgi:hypothetical protein
MMKSCLKLSSLPSTPRPDCTHKHKCVAFCSDDGLEQVFLADEWDRTPLEPTPNLSYSDILEFKAIQRSLPTAPQPPDPLSARPIPPLLTTIPIRLLPLCPETRSACGAHAKPPSPTAPLAAPFHVTFKASYTCPPSPADAPRVRPPFSAHCHRPNTPVTVASPRPRAQLNFLPLLDNNSGSISARSARNVPSPPSSPRTFAEFEASLALGEDILHHHSHHLHHDPSPQLSPCSDSRGRDGSGGDGHGHSDPHIEQPPVPVSTPALTDASSLPSSPSSSYLSLSSSPSFSLTSSPEPDPRGRDVRVRVQGDGSGRDDRGHAHPDDDDHDVALGKSIPNTPPKEPEAVVRIQVEPATPRATSASAASSSPPPPPPFSPISVSAAPATTLSTTTATSTTAATAPRRFAPSSPPGPRPQGLALKNAAKGASPILAPPSCRPVGVGPSSPKLVRL